MRPPSCIYRGDLQPPQVFISSTFEDRLVEVRFQIKKALGEAGMEPVMSELDNFPATGDKLYEDTIASVRSCQLFVLVVGHRYGSKHPELGESITRLEYRAAREAGMRTLVYVEDSLWQVFQDQRRSGESPSASSERGEVFAFLREIADEDNCNCVSFRNADEIISSLKLQIANLLGAYLRFQEKAADWIWTERYTHRVEETARIVWVLTPDFYWDYDDSEFADLVRDNIVQRGVKYFYLYRQSEGAAERIAEMEEGYEQAAGQSCKDSVFFAGIPTENFFWCAEQVLYNPGHPQRERGILVDTMSGRNKEHKFDVELGRDRRFEFRRHFQKLWSLYSNQPLVRLGSEGEETIPLHVAGTNTV